MNESVLSPDTFNITNFEGPLDLLLELIKNNEIDIYDIPIAEITNQYLQYVNLIQKIDANKAGSFLVMAATLLYIKSKMLLPVEIDIDDEYNDFSDPRKELVQQLLEYQKYKQVAEKLDNIQIHTERIIERKDKQLTFEFEKSENMWVDIKLYDLIKIFSSLVEIVDYNQFHVLKKEEVSVDDKMEEIKKMLEFKESINFYNLFKDKITRNELIVSFWAILELVKMSFIKIRQHNVFGDIFIFKVKKDPSISNK